MYTAIKAIAPLTILVWAPNTSQGSVHVDRDPSALETDVFRIVILTDRL